MPWLTGECGSPGRSLNMWWRRCVVTQLITDPSSAIVPATANTILSARFARKLWCAKSRWNPTLIPKPVKT